MKRIAAVFAAAIFAGSELHSLAWGSAGHMLIAAGAFRQLSPEFKAATIQTLQAHPDFAQWTNAYRPNPNVDLATFVVMKCSTWPDEIRRHGNPYDHPNWHFIDYPLHPPTFAFEADAKPKDDILYGLAQCHKFLADPQSSPELRAVYLSWLIHLVGDIHQPLHCESYFGDGYPKGDKGGNDFFVMPRTAGIPLHSLWDGLLGSSANPDSQWKFALIIEHNFPRATLSELKTNTTPEKWSLESRALAIRDGYLDGHLKGSKQKSDAPALPDGYTAAAKGVAEHQAALASCRLADEIVQSLGPIKAVRLSAGMTELTAVSKAMTPVKISAAQATEHYNDTVTVTATVAQVTQRASVTFINLDKKYPNSPLEAVVFQSNLDKFGDLQRFNGKKVEINGTVTQYHNKPEIVLETPDQIKLAPTP